MNGLFGQGGPSPEVFQRLKMLMMLKQQNPALFQRIMQAQQNRAAPQQALPRAMPAQSPFAAFGTPSPMMAAQPAQGMFTPPSQPVQPAQPVPPGQFARFAPQQAQGAMPKNFTPYNVSQVPQPQGTAPALPPHMTQGAGPGLAAQQPQGIAPALPPHMTQGAGPGLAAQQPQGIAPALPPHMTQGVGQQAPITGMFG